MKNIFVLPTDKPSRLGYLTKKGKEVFNDLRLFEKPMPNILDSENQNIYITSNEEIKEGDYWIYICPISGLDYGDNGNPIVKNNLPNTWFNKLHDKLNYKNIILTTDQDLIKDGVQAIDDEFIEWFVKNPSCEEVKYYTIDSSTTLNTIIKYKIIIPKEEPKQGNFYEDLVKYFETTPREKVLEDWNKSAHLNNVGPTVDEFLENTNKQQERMYSEEDMLDAWELGAREGLPLTREKKEKLFNQFKKK